MKMIILFFILLLSGCYLANGSPSQYEFWVKNQTSHEQIKNDWAFCGKQSSKFLSESDRELLEEGRKNWENLYSRKQDYDRYTYLIDKEDAYFRACIYQLGYRFNAPIYWCMSQDGDNTKICMENMKYRN